MDNTHIRSSFYTVYDQHDVSDVSSSRERSPKWRAPKLFLLSQSRKWTTVKPHGKHLQEAGLCELHCDKLLFSHTRRWYQFLFLSFFACFFIFRFYVMLGYLFCYYTFLQKLFSIYCSFYYLLLLLFNEWMNYFFIKKYFNFFMFRDVPACSGMFHVPGFIDAPCSNTVMHKFSLLSTRGEGYFLIRGYWGCVAGWGRIFTTRLTIMRSHF